MREPIRAVDRVLELPFYAGKKKQHGFARITFCRCCNLPPFRFKILLINIYFKRRLSALHTRISTRLFAIAPTNGAGEKIFHDFPLHFDGILRRKKNGEKNVLRRRVKTENKKYIHLDSFIECSLGNVQSLSFFSIVFV